MTEVLKGTNYTAMKRRNQRQTLKHLVIFSNLLLLGYWSGMDLLKVPLGQQGQLRMDLWKVLLKDQKKFNLIKSFRSCQSD